MGDCLRDPAEVMQAYQNALNHYKRYTNDPESRKIAGSDDPGAFADARFAKLLLTYADVAVRHGRFDRAQAWCGEARRIAEPLYNHPEQGKGLLSGMAYTEKSYARAIVPFKGDLEAARRLWTKYEELAKRAGNKSPDRYRFEVDEK